MNLLSSRLPDFPWDSLTAAKAIASAHPGGIVDLSVGTPVDPTPQLALDALQGAADSPGYPTVWGTAALREAIIGYLERRWESVPLAHEQVLPTIGSKELVALLPLLLGLTSSDTVVIPEMAYPTYDVGAKIAGCRVIATDDPGVAAAAKPKLIWINSPANPHGQVLDFAETCAWIAAAGASGAVLASDECYGEFAWDAEPVSVLNRRVNGGNIVGLLAVHSLSKRSNVAGYRAGFIAGDQTLIAELLELRKHAGMMVSGPVQAAMVALLNDDRHVAEQRQRYLARRTKLRIALEVAGFSIEHSQGSLYLWATQGKHCRETVDYLAKLGILVAPGDFYGPKATPFVRVALTATDERIDAASARLQAV